MLKSSELILGSQTQAGHYKFQRFRSNLMNGHSRTGARPKQNGPRFAACYDRNSPGRAMPATAARLPGLAVLFTRGRQVRASGEPGWDRTIDTLIKSQVLYH